MSTQSLYGTQSRGNDKSNKLLNKIQKSLQQYLNQSGEKLVLVDVCIKRYAIVDTEMRLTIYGPPTP